jgi:pilus assembly protein CpaF
MRQLIKNALRMKVRWIIPGETRDGAAFDMLSGVNTGHCAMSTIHANDSNAAISRLETLCQMAEASLPVTAIRKLIASGFKLIIQTAQLKDGSRKVVQVTEIVGMDGDNVELEDILSFDYEKKILKPTGYKPTFIEGLIKRGFVVPEWLR